MLAAAHRDCSLIFHPCRQPTDWTPMPTDEERQAYINKYMESIKDNPPTPDAVKLHKLLAKYDLDVEIGFGDYRTNIQSGPLDAKTMELIYVIGYTIRGYSPKNIGWHMRQAVAAGATPEEILNALELLLLIDGVVPFMRAVEVWAEVTGVEGIEPTNA
jgi:4-carboxymuconolactone decarboxylase